MNAKKSEEDLQRVFNFMDEWFARFGEVNPQAHKELKKLLRDSIPDAKDLEYLLDTEARKVEVTLFVPTYVILFKNTKKLADGVLDVLKECLNDYDILVKVRRYQAKG